MTPALGGESLRRWVLLLLLAATVSWLSGVWPAFGAFSMELHPPIAREQGTLGPDRLPTTSQRSLARADSLRLSLDRLIQDARFENAQTAAEALLELEQKQWGEDHTRTALARRALARTRQSLGDLPGAEPLFEQCLAVQRRHLDDADFEIANTLHRLAALRFDQGRYAASDSLFTEAVARYALHGESLELADTLNDLGILCAQQGRYDEAESVYTRARALREKLAAEDTPEFAALLSNLAVLYTTQARYAEADPLYRRSLSLKRALLREDHPDLARTLNNFGALLYEQGNYAEAAAVYWETLALKRRALPTDHPDLALGMSNMSAVQFQQGEIDTAIDLLSEALDIFRRKLPAGHPNIGLVQANLATMAVEREDYAQAESLDVQALEIFQKSFGARHERVAGLHNNLAKVRMRQGNWDSAEASLREALTIYEEQFGRRHRGTADSYCNLAALHLETGQLEAAEEIARRAVTIYDELLLDSSPTAVSALTVLARAQIRRGRIDDALGTLQTASSSFEAARRRVSVKALSRTAFASTGSPYALKALVHVRRGEGQLAWEALEKHHARALLDMLQTKAVRRLNEQEAREERELDQELTRLEQGFAALDSNGPSAAADSIRARLLEARARWLRLQGDLSLRYPIAEGGTFTLDRIQAAMPEGAAIVGWLDVDESHFAYLLPKQGSVEWVELPSGDVEETAARYRTLLSAPGSDDAQRRNLGTELHRAWLAPLQASLDQSRALLFVPSGPLLGIALETLPTENETLLDEHEVGYIPSATAFAWLHERARPAGPPSVLALGDPEFAADSQVAVRARRAEPAASGLRGVETVVLTATPTLPPLEHTRREVADIAALFDVKDVLLGEDASESALVTRAREGQLSSFRFVHLATHAIIDDQQPGRSYLALSQTDLPDALESVLAGARLMDGRLTMDEVLREWQLDADLVVLSACDTGLGRRAKGEGTIGFAHAFFRAGARRIVVSSWKVDDRATRFLMVRFYQNLLQREMSTAAALRDAKLWLRGRRARDGTHPYEHPAYWAGFVLLGDPD